MSTDKDIKAQRKKKAWLIERIIELQSNAPKNLLMMVEPANLAEIYFKLRDGLKRSRTGIKEDFSNGDDCKTALESKLYNNADKNRYKVEFSNCGTKNGGIMALVFNRQSNMVEEYYFPKGSFKYENIYILYNKESHEPIGKYSPYLKKRYPWNYKKTKNKNENDKL